MVYLQTTYELCFGEAYFEYFESCDFSRENTNIDVSVFMLDLRMINMSSECEYDWYWKISACSTEYEVYDSFASLTRHQASYSGSTGWYFRYQSIHIQITYTSLFRPALCCINKLLFVCILFRSSPFLQENKCKHPIILFFWDGIQIPGITIEVSNLIGTYKTNSEENWYLGSHI